jgi:hypothetical protein
VTFTGVSAGDAGNYQLVATASGTGFTLASTTANLRLSDPRITASPANATANYKGSASFTATVTTASAPLKYGWYDGANALGNGSQPDGSYAIGATGTTGAGTSFTLTLTLTNVSYQDIGSYTLYVTNQSGFNNYSAPATLAVNDPIITAQPTNPAVAAGGNATFAVGAAGSATVGYQWYEGATALSEGGTTATGSARVTGATAATLTLTGVQDADDGSYYCQITGSASGQTTNSAAATLTVQDPLTIVTPPKSLTERVGDHLAFTVVVTGGGPQFQWKFNSNPIAGATTSALVLTNIQTGSNGIYSVTVQNIDTAPQTFNATLTVINSTILPLWPTNLVVARVGDGAQALSGVTGNTLYLDQYTPAGTYVNTIQVPDEGTGQGYNTGGSIASDSMPFGSPALIFQGAGGDAAYEAMLTLSGVNQQYLCFAGYCQAYPFSGTGGSDGDDVTAPGTGSTANWRGLATVDADGIYSLAYTNLGLYTGGNHTIRSMVTLDGTNFWTTGQAGSGTVKFVNRTVTNYANGSGIPGSVGTGVSGGGGRIVQILKGALPGFSSVSNLVYSETGSTNNNGLYAASGTPEPSTNVAFTALLYTGSSSATTNYAQPGDFAFSPDNKTIYVADDRPFTATNSDLSGGIQRWDANSLGGYSYTYTLAPLTGQTNGAVGLTVDFSAHGTWGTNDSGQPITGAKLYATTYGAATNSLVQIVDNGPSSTPTVLVTARANEALRGVRFGPATVTTTRPRLTSETYLGPGVGFQLNFTGPAETGYSIWTTTNVALSPIESTWTKLTTGAFSGGTDSYTDPNGGTKPQQFYIISVP